MSELNFTHSNGNKVKLTSTDTDAYYQFRTQSTITVMEIAV